MSEASNVKLHNPPDLHKPLGYSHVAEVTGGKLVYIAGQVGLDAARKPGGQGRFRGPGAQGVRESESRARGRGRYLPRRHQAELLLHRLGRSLGSPSGGPRDPRHLREHLCPAGQHVRRRPEIGAAGMADRGGSRGGSAPCKPLTLSKAFEGVTGYWSP